MKNVVYVLCQNPAGAYVVGIFTDTDKAYEGIEADAYLATHIAGASLIEGEPDLYDDGSVATHHVRLVDKYNVLCTYEVQEAEIQ